MAWKYFSQPTQKENPSSPGNDGGKLSEKELEKYLLEKRLDLQKYFVFNLGELKTFEQADTGALNIRIVSEKLGNDLFALTNLCQKHLNEKGYDNKGVKVKKRRITFLSDSDDENVYFDDDWDGNNLDRKITSGNLYILFEKEKSYDWPNGWFTVEIIKNTQKKYLIWTSDFQLRIKRDVVAICENKEKALEILKTDPTLEGKV